jgi:hypothetical protein
MPMSAIGVMPIAPLVSHTHGIVYVEPDGTSLQEQISNAVRTCAPKTLGPTFVLFRRPNSPFTFCTVAVLPSLVPSRAAACLAGTRTRN